MFHTDNVTAQAYPRLIDIFSGDATVARVAHDLGWRTSNILCVDMYISTTPLLKGVRWKYWDLSRLAWALRNSGDIPKEVTNLKESFDIAISQYGESNSLVPIGLPLCRYFVRKGGYILTDDPNWFGFKQS